MFRKVLSLLLAANIFTCPFYCGAKLDASDMAAIEKSASCCPECAKHSPDEVPGDQRDDGCPSVCQCICGGAVVDDMTPCDGNPDWDCWHPAANFNIRPSIARFVGGLSSFAAIQPEDGMNKGRAMRYLFMSLTC